MRKIPLSAPVFAGKEWEYLRDCLDSGWVSSAGKYVDLFEERMGAFTGSPFAVSAVNGTAALHTALLVAGVLPGDRVIVPTLTFVATVNPVLYCGAIPVFIDAEEKTLNMDPGKAVEAIQELIRKTRPPRAVIVTHLYGHPCDLGPLLQACRQHGIVLIEDACESLGSRYRGKMTGTLGDIGCLSFNGNKIITTGGGGMVLTANAAYARKARHLTTQARNHAVEYIHDEIGYNYRMTNLQAALGAAQLERLPSILEAKKKIAAHYRTALAGVPGLCFLDQPPWAESNFWLNTVLLRRRKSRFRGSLIAKLENEGIETRPLFAPLHTQAPFFSRSRRPLPVAESVSGLNLPSSVSLKGRALRKITENLKAAIGDLGRSVGGRTVGQPGKKS